MKVFISIFLLLILSSSFSQSLIPANRLGKFDNVGATIATVYDDSVNIIDYGAVGDSITDCTLAFQTAINEAHIGVRLIFVPAGVYKLTQTIVLKSNTVIKGDGSTTHLVFDHLSNGFNIYGTYVDTFVNVYSDTLKRKSSFIVANSAGLPNLNDSSFVEITQLNGAWDSDPAVWAQYSLGHVGEVIYVTGDTIYLKDSLAFDMGTALNPQISVINPIVNVGIECLKIEKLAIGANYAPNIDMLFAYNCWVKGVESNKSDGPHINVFKCLNNTFFGSYFYDSFLYDGQGGRGYGILVAKHSRFCLAENNCFKKLRHALMLKEGACDNVFGYNYSNSTFRTDGSPADEISDISLHGHYPHHNLIEGNIAQNMWTDKVWGPSGNYNTFFRNRINLHGIKQTSNTTYYQNYVGNETTNTSTIFVGYYYLFGGNHFEYGNNIKGNITPQSSDQNIPEISYYLAQKPNYWGNYLPFPNIGTTYPVLFQNPAQVRFDNQQYTDCNEYLQPITSVKELKKEEWNSYVNYEKNELKFYSDKKFKQLKIISTQGKTVYSVNYENSVNETNLAINLKKGIYLIQTEFEVLKFVGF